MSAVKDAYYSDPKRRPARPSFKGGNVPQSMRDLPRWVGWKFDWKKDESRWTKIPLDPNRKCEGYAKSNDPTTWAAFNEALTAANARHCRAPQQVDGLGYVFNDDGRFGLDIDGCRNPETCELTELASSIVKAFGTYAEVSPSGTGIKLFGLGRLPWNKGRKVKLSDGRELELYDRGRFFCVTGQLIDGAPSELVECSAPLSELIAQHFPDPPQKKRTFAPHAERNGHARGLSDSEVIGRITAKHSALWSGDTSGSRDDDSAADLALCNHIAFWVGGPDHNRIDDIFRQSGLMRDKWERSDYRAMTIGKALEGRTEYFTATRGREPSAVFALSTRGAPPAPAAEKIGAEIILDWMREHYRPLFRRKARIVCHRGEEVFKSDACSVMDFAILARLRDAKDVPLIGRTNTVDESKLPKFFRDWAPAAWGQMLHALPDEDHADVGALQEAVGDEFRRLIRNVMLDEVTIPNEHKAPERRSLIEWCNRWAKLGRWKRIRSKCCWCKLRLRESGELVLMVAIRAELFAQMKADKRLIELGQNTFARRAERYGVGTTDRGERPEGESAVTLNPALIAELVSDLPPEPDDTPDPAAEAAQSEG